MAKYKLKKSVINVNFDGVVYTDKKLIFDAENKKQSFSADELEASYKAGFLDKLVGKDYISFADASKNVAKKNKDKLAKKNALSTDLGGLRGKLSTLESKLGTATEKDKAAISKEIEKVKGEISEIENKLSDLKK